MTKLPQHQAPHIPFEPTPKIKVAINGFGRIGRTVAKILSQSEDIELVQINDVVANLDNMAYLYNYDSTYGKPPFKAEVRDASHLVIGDRAIRFTHEEDFAKIPWQADYVIEATGLNSNVVKAKKLVEQHQLKKCIVTNSPVEGADKIVIMGVNHKEYDASRHHVVGSSICDANAIAHFVKWVGENFGFHSASVTTLHPWLSYQNLVDGPVKSVASPTHYWSDFSLGRSSIGTLIPKHTTAVKAVLQVLPEYEGQIDAVSYRVPTGIVSSADLSICLAKEIDKRKLLGMLEEFVQDSPYLSLNTEPLVSMDYLGDPSSAILDHQWTKLINGRLLKLLLWYDNEWGYSSRIIDLLRLVERQSHP